LTATGGLFLNESPVFSAFLLRWADSGVKIGGEIYHCNSSLRRLVLIRNAFLFWAGNPFRS
jgi:hypothetical protein